MSRNDSREGPNLAGVARLFGRVALIAVGGSAATWVSIHATTWAAVTLRTWFLTTVGTMFLSTMVMAQTSSGDAGPAATTPAQR